MDLRWTVPEGLWSIHGFVNVVSGTWSKIWETRVLIFKCVSTRHQFFFLMTALPRPRGVMLWRVAILEVLRSKVIPTGLRNFRANKKRFFSKKAISKTHMKTDTHDNQLPQTMTHEPILNDCIEPSSGVMLRRGAIWEAIPLGCTFKNQNMCYPFSIVHSVSKSLIFTQKRL